MVALPDKISTPCCRGGESLCNYDTPIEKNKRKKSPSVHLQLGAHFLTEKYKQGLTAAIEDSINSPHESFAVLNKFLSSVIKSKDFAQYFRISYTFSFISTILFHLLVSLFGIWEDWNTALFALTEHGLFCAYNKTEMKIFWSLGT